jgi:hypothetical protein
MAVAVPVPMSNNRQRRQPDDARLPAGAGRRGASALLALAMALGWGCAVRDQSPREPFLVPPAAAAGPPAPAPPTFEVLEQWHWRDTVAGASAFLPAAGSGGDNVWLGLHPASAFRVVHGHCPDCRTPEAALWYFRDEVIAVPKPTLPITAIDPPADGPTHPSVLWIGAPEVIEGASLAEDARTLSVNGSDIPIALTPQIPTNFSYADHSTVRFFRQRTIRARGAVRADGDGGTFVARTLWPEDARLDSRALVLEPLVENEMLSTLIEAQTDGAGEAFPARLLFERRDGPRQWAGKPVLALVLSGAQGDDDGARAGHLAVATGVLGPRGEWHDWIADNFYPIADVSAKGIIPASVPLDNYLMDLNSGQLYYRPGYMLVAVLREARVARDIHAALQQTMLAYYCQAFEFDRAAFNSTAMTMDPIRGLGWRIPRTGPTSRLLGVLAAPVATVARFSFAAGRAVFSAFTAETSRQMPRVAFEVAGHDLLYLASRGAGEAELTPFERRLAEDVEAVVFVRLPQIPSERRMGTFPARSLLAYGVQVFTTPTDYESGPETGTRELPGALAASCQVEPAAGIEH